MKTKTKLRKKCAFSMDDLSDMVCLHEDMNNILSESVQQDVSSPELFIDNVRKYLSDRPNVHKEFSPEKTFENFVLEFCHFHLKANTLHSVLTGKEKRKEVIKAVKDDIEEFKNFRKKFMSSDDSDYDRSVAIPTRETGDVILDTVEEQSNIVDESLMKMIDSDSAIA